MGLTKLAGWLEKAIYPVSRVINNVGAGIIFAMMALVTIDVLMRYSLNMPIKGTVELSEFCLGAIVFLGLAYTAVQRGHISVTVLVERLPQRVQTIIDNILYPIATGLFAVVTWRTAIFAKYIWGTGSTTGDLRLPISPMIFLAAFGTAILCLVCLVIFIQSLAKVVKK